MTHTSTAAGVSQRAHNNTIPPVMRLKRPHVLIKSFQRLFDKNEFSLQTFNLFPLPIEIFAPDGTTIFVNSAFLELHRIPDADMILGKYNLLNDPVCNDQMGLRETIERAFRGEEVLIPDFRVPIQDVIDRGIIKEKPFESAIMEVYLSPIMDKGKIIFVLCVFVVKSIFCGKPEVAKAKEYLDLNWRGKFEPHTTAKSLNMSVAQLYNLFKKHIGMTPGEYHKICKIEHIKEKLADKSLTVEEAFRACGEDSKGQIARVFKKITGLSPARWRKQIALR